VVVKVMKVKMNKQLTMMVVSHFNIKTTRYFLQKRWKRNLKEKPRWDEARYIQSLRSFVCSSQSLVSGRHHNTTIA